MCNSTDRKARKSQAAWLPILLLALALGGCQTGRRGLTENLLENQGAWWYRGERFSHLVIPGPGSPRSPVVHIYIEGDGQPWINHRFISRDPTPDYPLALRLMMQDPQTSFYLGRPCYFSGYDSGQNERGTPCQPQFWTGGRYSAAVVDSMIEALEAILQAHSFSRVVVIGYSGGGTLAYLMAARTNRIDQVVTIAANLDHNAWTAYHGYSALADSLDPVETVAPDHVSQLHLQGGRDKNVPHAVTENFNAGKQGRWVTFEDYDHVCCWEKKWPEILRTLVNVTDSGEEKISH